MTIIQWFRALRCPHFSDPRDPRESTWRHIRSVSIFEHRYVYDVSPGSEHDAVTSTRHTVQKHYVCTQCGTERIDCLLPDNMPPLPGRSVLTEAVDIARRVE